MRGLACPPERRVAKCLGNHYRVDRASSEEIDGYLRGLLTRLDDRLPVKDFVVITEFIDVGEFGLALEHMADALSNRSSQ
jgi:hypothetical protein